MYQFHIPKMSCGGCVRNITNAIKKVDDAATIDADISTKMVRVETAIPEATIIKAMTDGGYQPAL
ncbi:heavy-metal-associated domain-containing protein [Methylotenera mobilis]|jgi:copper chaperone|uniref:heavy-metal-associated domain-containing protein n=1 Tax=Methylotenera mobilis TaxID=359408 RepID=UPI000368552F|nr:heavy-metal-associated domain-containing protein [Methylotenera mobilis]MDP3008165.1 heavy-metal-associated domain-containing protein [Methylococcales bacterium]PPC93295.1 MAG: copper chaperone [Methylotenera sp.]